MTQEHNEEQNSNDSELKIVGYTTDIQGVRYTARTENNVQDWLGRAEGGIEPVVLKSEADAKIKELSDMVMSLSETQEKPLTMEAVEDFIRGYPAGYIKMADVKEPAYIIEDKPHHEEVVMQVLKRIKESGIEDHPVVPDLMMLPLGLDDNTRELVVMFALALALKLKSAEDKYGYADSWLENNWEAKCVDDFLLHIQKGDPRDVAAYCAFMWYHGWKTRNSPITSPSV
jgi:hypothetical protein